MYLDDGMRKSAYWIVVTNSVRGNTAVQRIAQGEAYQENLIKDCASGLAVQRGIDQLGVRAERSSLDGREEGNRGSEAH